MNMAKAAKKKTAKEASALFHNIIAASLKGNAPQLKKKKLAKKSK